MVPIYPVEHATTAAPAVNLMALLGKKLPAPLQARLRGQTRPPVRNMNAALSAGGQASMLDSPTACGGGGVRRDDLGTFFYQSSSVWSWGKTCA